LWYIIIDDDPSSFTIRNKEKNNPEICSSDKWPEGRKDKYIYISLSLLSLSWPALIIADYNAQLERKR
jgi:hypothetical protein